MLDAYMNAAEEAVSKPRARTFAQKPSMFRWLTRPVLCYNQIRYGRQHLAIPLPR
jgi:hypothetical protein